MSKYPIHPLALAFPEKDADDFEALVKSIREDGQEHPAWLLDGMIIDGRHRDKACDIIGIELAVKEFNGTFEEAKRLVKRENGFGKVMSASQRAVVFAQVDAMTPDGQPAAPKTEVAAEAQVADRTLRKAQQVIREAAPEVVAAVKSGEISLNKALATLKPAPKKPATPEKTIGDQAKENTDLDDMLKRIGKACGKPLESDLRSGKYPKVNAKGLLQWGNLEDADNMLRVAALVTKHDMTVKAAWDFLDLMPSEATKVDTLMLLAEAEPEEPYVIELKGFVITVQRPKRKGK